MPPVGRHWPSDDDGNDDDDDGDDDGDGDDDDDKDDDDPDDRDCQGGRLLPEAPAAETGDRFSRSLRPTREARRGKIAICNKASKNCVVRIYFCL